MAREQGSPGKLKKAAKDTRTPVIRPTKTGKQDKAKHRIKG